MTSGSYGQPCLKDQLVAMVLAALCSILFLGKAVGPGVALLPFPPEALDPWRDDAAARGAKLDTFLVGNSSMGDKYGQSLAWDRIQQDALGEAHLPLWTRSIGGGSPFVPQMSQVYQPWNLLLLLVPALGAYGIWFFLHQTLFGWFAYRFLRRIGCGHAAGLIGVVAVVLGMWMQARVHHNVIVTAALPLFPMLSCAHELVTRGGGREKVGALGIWAGLAWLSSFPAVALQSCALVFAYAIVCAAALPRGERRAPLLRVALGFALGAVMAMAQLIPMAIAGATTSRGDAPREVLLGWLENRALQPAHLLLGLWPDLLHWPSDHFYGRIDSVHYSWASLWLTPGIMTQQHNFPETAWSIGIAPLFLALTGVRAHPRREAVFFATVAMLGFALALALPGVFEIAGLLRVEKLAGDVRRFLFLPAMALPVLAALGTQHWLARGAGKTVPALVAALAFGSLALFVTQARSETDFAEQWATRLAPIHGATVQMFHDKLREFPTEALANAEHLRTTLLRAGIVAALTLILLLGRWQRLSPALLVALTAGELWHAGRGTIVPVEIERLAPPKILAPLLALQDRGSGDPVRFQRLCAPEDRAGKPPLLMPNLGAFLGIEDLAAYNPQPPRRMEELALALEPDALGKASVVAGGAGVDMLREPKTLTHPLLDLLGCRFVLSGATLAEVPNGIRDATPKGYVGKCRLYERTTVLPWATLATRARIVENKAQRIELLGDRTRDFANEVILEDRTLPLPSGDGPARFEVLRKQIEQERVILRVKSDRPGWLRLADSYDPGWTGHLDGKTCEIRIADHHLRAIWLPPGEHTVEMRYDAPLVKMPRHLSLVALAACLVLVFSRRRTA